MRNDVFSNVKMGEAFTFRDEKNDPNVNQVYYVKTNKWLINRIDGDSMTVNMMLFWGRGAEEVIVYDSVAELQSERLIK